MILCSTILAMLVTLSVSYAGRSASAVPFPSGCDAGDHWLKSGQVSNDAQDDSQAFADWRQSSREYAACAGRSAGRRHYMYLLLGGKADFSAAFAFDGVELNRAFTYHTEPDHTLSHEYEQNARRKLNALAANKSCPSDLRRLAALFAERTYVGTDWP